MLIFQLDFFLVLGFISGYKDRNPLNLTKIYLENKNFTNTKTGKKMNEVKPGIMKIVFRKTETKVIFSIFKGCLISLIMLFSVSFLLRCPIHTLATSWLPAL